MAAQVYIVWLARQSCCAVEWKQTNKNSIEGRALTAEHNIPAFTDACLRFDVWQSIVWEPNAPREGFSFSLCDDLSHWTLFSPSKPCSPSGDMAPKGKRHSLCRDVSVAWCREWSAVIQNDRVSPFVSLPEKCFTTFPTNVCLSSFFFPASPRTSQAQAQVQALFSMLLNVFQGWRFHSSTPGTYKSEENQLLLKVYQVKGPTQHYISKFKNDNWAMDGYVSDAAGAAGCLFLAWSCS